MAFVIFKVFFYLHYVIVGVVYFLESDEGVSKIAELSPATVSVVILMIDQLIQWREPSMDDVQLHQHTQPPPLRLVHMDSRCSMSKVQSYLCHRIFPGDKSCGS